MRKTFLKFIAILISLASYYAIANDILAVTEMDPTDSLEDYVNLGEWNTDGDFDSWTYNSHVSDCAVYSGSITGRVSGNDEHIDLNLTSAGLYINLSSGMVVEIKCRYDAGTANNWSQWFLNGTGERVVYVRGSGQQPADGNFHIFRTIVLTNFGPVSTFRLDQYSGQEGSTFDVDYVRIGRFTSNVAYTNTVIPVFADNNNFVLTKMRQNLTNASFGWEHSSTSAWSFSWFNHNSSSGFTAVVDTDISASRYSASLDLSKFVNNYPKRNFLFGGWIKSMDKSVERNYYANIRLSGDHNFYKDLIEFSDRGVWTYFEKRIIIPENIKNVKLTLTALTKSKKVYFSSLYLIPESSSKPVWRKTPEVRIPGTLWHITNCQYRLKGSLFYGQNNQPVWCDFDLTRLILMAGSRQPIDPSSIKVVAVNSAGATQIVPAVFDNPLSNLAEHYMRNGTFKWRSVNGYSNYEIYFNLADSNSYYQLKTKKTLGIGEMLNCPSDTPAWVGRPGTGIEVKDVDGDGDWDIYGNCVDAGVWLLRNIGSNSSPKFLPRQKPLETDDVSVMPVAYTDIDWNTNGSSDLIICEKHPRGTYIDGAWLELKVRLQSDGVVNMIDLSGADVILSDATWFASCNGDFDGDGLDDVVVGTAESDLVMLLNRGMNGGNPKVEKVRIPFNIYPDSPYDSGDMTLKPFVIDWNCDGRDDIIFTAWEGNCYLLINSNNVGRAEFEPPKILYQSSAVINTAGSPAPEIVDWDDDGDLDLLIGDVNGYITYYENQPSNSFPNLIYKGELKNDLGDTIRITAAAAGGTVQGPAEKWWGYLSCQSADVDDDGDIDLIINDSLGRLRWIENIGTRSNPLLSHSIRQFQYESSGSYYDLITPWRNRPGVADWTGDGSLEIIVLNDHAEIIRYTIDPDNPDKLLLGETLRNENGYMLKLYPMNYRPEAQGRSQFDVGDWDNDGDLDILVGRPRTMVNNSNGGNFLLLENLGSNADPRLKIQTLSARGLPFTEWIGWDGHDQWHSGVPCMVDWDSDGNLDLITGAVSGRIFFYNHDFFVGNYFPVLQSLSFENKTNIIFDFKNDINTWTESLETSPYPLEWVTNGPSMPECGILISLFWPLFTLLRNY